MTLWLVGDCRLAEPLFLNEESKTVVIMGAISSDHDISLKVNNLLLLGKISTSKDLSINAKQGFFNAGSALGKNLTVNCIENHNGLTQQSITKLRALGINITLLPTGLLSTQPPQQGILTFNNYLLNRLIDLMDWVSFQRSSSDQIGLRSILVERVISMSPSTSNEPSDVETEQNQRVESLRERRLGIASLPVSTQTSGAFLPPLISPPASPI